MHQEPAIFEVLVKSLTSDKLDTSLPQELFHDIQETRELREDDRFVLTLRLLLDLLQDFDELSGLGTRRKSLNVEVVARR